MTTATYDPDRTKSTACKCAEALAEHRATNEPDPLWIMTSLVDAPVETEVDGIPVSGRCFIPTGLFFLMTTEELPHDPF